MKKISMILCSVVLVLSVTGLASAITITDLYGDEDGFNINVADGEGFSEYDVMAAESANDDEGFTDTWIMGDQSWNHTYDISGMDTITSITLELMTGGQGYEAVSQIFIDGELVGTLTDGDDTGPDYNYARMDTFDLMPYVASLLDGASELTVDVSSGTDGWVLDYSKLTITGDGAASPAVPEPGTMFLLGFGLVGLAVFGRRKKNFEK
ncbi:MAG: PEP-CTERM sorting domain-containing protein [Desulfobacterales bacterium]|nr:PEP-CTERM sorting domain-containing protein [Desulfobacterales bacterium]